MNRASIYKFKAQISNYFLSPPQLLYMIRYRCLIFFGKVKIESIRRIEVGKNLYSGMRPATAMKGLIIYYDKYEEVYISPVDNEEVINALQKINPEIEVSYHNKKQK